MGADGDTATATLPIPVTPVNDTPTAVDETAAAADLVVVENAGQLFTQRSVTMNGAVVNSAMPLSSGTRSLQTSLVALRTAIFSSSDSEQFSPMVPSMMRPWMPSARSATRCTRWSSGPRH